MDGSWRSNLEPEQCGQGGYTCRERGQAQCGWDTASTCQCYLFAVSLPPHSATEQVSLKKVSTTTHFVSGRKSDTKETSKQKKPRWRSGLGPRTARRTHSGRVGLGGDLRPSRPDAPFSLTSKAGRRRAVPEWVHSFVHSFSLSRERPLSWGDNGGGAPTPPL